MQESQHGHRACESDVTCEDAHEEHEGDSQGDAAYLDLAKIDSHGNDNSVEQSNVRHAVRGRK